MLLADISDLCQHLWTHHVQQVTCHIAKTSITTFQQMFNGAVFHCEDKQASSLRIYCPCLYHQAIESTFNDPSIFEPVSQEPTNNMANLTHGPRAQVVNSLLATSRPKRRRGSKVVDLSCRSSTPPLAPCSTSWPGWSSSLFRWLAPTTLPQEMFTHSLTSCGQHLSTSIWFWSIKTWLDSSPALTRKDSLGRGSCFWTSFDHIWMWPTMRYFPFTQGNPTIQVISSKVAPFVD